MGHKLLIDGELVAGASELDVINPATGKVFAQSERADQTQAERAIAAARRAFPTWAALSFAERGRKLNRFAEAIKARGDEMARLLTLENGKPLEDAKIEVTLTWQFLQHFAAQELKPRVIRESAKEMVIAERYPLGVTVAITPWNFPLVLLMFKAGAALITGNTLIAKPAPTTPLTTLLLGEAAAATLPPGVFQTLVDLNDIGPILTSHPDVAHVSFTGSTPTGAKVMKSGADTIKRLTLELGGNDPAIILDDANLAEIVPKVYFNATANSGQVCYGIKRIYVPRKQVDRFCDLMVAEAAKSKVGDGLDPATTLGPIQNQLQYEKVLGYLEDAHREGKVITGGKALGGDGYFVPVTVVRDLPNSARVVREEQFGLIIPIVAYDSLDEAVAMANDTEFGLGGSVWTSDMRRGLKVASRIESGTVWVNQHFVNPLDLPFGGAKRSGIGLQNGIEGLEECTQLRIVNAVASVADAPSYVSNGTKAS